MSQAPRSSSDVPHCPDCGAEVQGFGDCWLCQRRNTNLRHIQPAPLEVRVADQRRRQSTQTTLMGLSVAGFVMVALVGLGLMSLDTTLGVAFWILVVPALVAIVVVVSQRRVLGGSATGGMSIFANIVMAIGLAIGTSVLLAVGTVGVLFVLCLASFR